MGETGANGATDHRGPIHPPTVVDHAMGEKELKSGRRDRIGHRPIDGIADNVDLQVPSGQYREDLSVLDPARFGDPGPPFYWPQTKRPSPIKWPFCGAAGG